MRGFFSTVLVSDPKNTTGGEKRVMRGGSYLSEARLCRAAYRGRANPDDRVNTIGFRVLLASD